MTRRRLLAGLFPIAGLVLSLPATVFIGATMSQAAAVADPENTIYLDLKDGRVVIQLLPDIAPKHVERVKLLARKGFYDGTPFHRVIEGFMAQGGDPTGTGSGGSGLGNLPAEFSRTRKFLRGTVGAARTQDPNSADSQFFIMFAPAPNLDGQYTIWGQVISGMEHVDAIKRGSGGNGLVRDPDKIVHFRVAADVKE
jgi:peptidylprolyl isomerase